MKIAKINNDKIEFQDIEKPLLKDKGAIIEVFGSGLCGSDIVKYLHKKNGVVLGHEIVGKIVEINSDTDFKIGDLIIMGHHVPCYKCNYCKGESYSMCDQFKKTNIIPGGFSEYIYASELHLENTTFKVPDNLSEIEASFMEPLGCCVRAVERAELKENSTVLVVGLGTIGLLMGQALKAYGHKVIGLDLIEARIELSKKFGFDDGLKFHENIKTELEKLYGKNSIDVVFLTAGANSGVSTATTCVRNGGTVLVFSSIKNDELGFSNNEIYYRELKVLSAYSATPETLKKSLNLLKDKKVRVDNLTVEYNFNDLQQAIDDTISNKIMKAYIRIKK